MVKAPRTHEILSLFKELIDITAVQSILEPTSDSSDKIFVPQGNVLKEPMNHPYWSRIVIINRADIGVVDEDETRTIPYGIHVRVDIQPPNDPNYDLELSMQAIHEQIYLAVDKKSITPNFATQVMPFFRVRRPTNSIKTEGGFYVSSAVYKTILSTYE